METVLSRQNVAAHCIKFEELSLFDKDNTMTPALEVKLRLFKWCETLRPDTRHNLDGSGPISFGMGLTIGCNSLPGFQLVLSWTHVQGLSQAPGATVRHLWLILFTHTAARPVTISLAAKDCRMEEGAKVQRNVRARPQQSNCILFAIQLCDLKSMYG